MATERGELGKFFDWLDDFNFYEKIDKEFDEIMSLVIPNDKFNEKMLALRKKVKWMKKNYEEDCEEKDGLYKIAREAGYDYCWCCNKWKKPLGEACTLWDLPE